MSCTGFGGYYVKLNNKFSKHGDAHSCRETFVAGWDDKCVSIFYVVSNNSIYFKDVPLEDRVKNIARLIKDVERILGWENSNIFETDKPDNIIVMPSKDWLNAKKFNADGANLNVLFRLSFLSLILRTGAWHIAPAKTIATLWEKTLIQNDYFKLCKTGTHKFLSGYTNYTGTDAGYVRVLDETGVSGSQHGSLIND